MCNVMCDVINIITVVIILLFLKERKDREIGGWVVLCGVLKYEECVSLGGASVQSSFLTSHQTHTLTLEQSLNININITV